MEYIKMQISEYGYRSIAYSHDDMVTLASFFTTDVGCPAYEWESWILSEDEKLDVTSSNINFFEKEGRYLYISFSYDSRPKSKRTRLKIDRQNIVQLLHVWREKVCKAKPKYVVITGDDGIFTMQTYDTEDTSDLE